VKRVAAAVLVLAMAGALFSADVLLGRVSEKLERIDSGQVKRGSVVVFTAAELNAWVRERVPQLLEGVRNPKLQLGDGAATGSALIDFVKIRQSQGLETNALLGKLLEGERPVKITAHVDSGQGRATVDVTGVEISGITIAGPILDFLIKDFFLPLFPEAKIGQPFELRDNIDRIDIRPDAVRVVIRK
jgi:hypothetical protein